MPLRGSFSITLMCAMAPSRLRCSVLRKPLLTAMAITSAITPAATPSTEMAVMTRDHRFLAAGPQIAAGDEELKRSRMKAHEITDLPQRLKSMPALLQVP